MKEIRKILVWSLAIGVVTGLSLLVVFSPQWQSGGARVDSRNSVRLDTSFAPDSSESAVNSLIRPFSSTYILASNEGQIFGNDLTVEPGQTLTEDVVVYEGEVEVQEGGRIAGSLVVYSGDVDIEEGGTVEGDVSLFSGDISVAGRVDGDIAAWSGDVRLDATASVGGDVSVVSGEVERDSAAYVGGSVLRGPNLDLPIPVQPDFPFRIDPTENISLDRQPTFVGRLGALILRMIGAALFTIITALLVAMLMFARPEIVVTVKETMFEQTALSFVVGLVVNLTLLFLSGILAITVCLLPIALLPMLGLAVLNVAGWAAISEIVGRRLIRFLNVEVQPALVVAVGALVTTGLGSFLWALGGCFRFVGFVIVLIIASLGAGAVLVPWLNRDSGSGVGPSAAPEDDNTDDQKTDSKPVSSDGELDGDEASGESDASVAENVDTGAEEDITGVDAIDSVLDDVEDDDFTRMRNVGPVTDGRLKEAGIRTFAQLAAATPEQVADATGWSVSRVNDTDLIGQARALTSEGN